MIELGNFEIEFAQYHKPRNNAIQVYEDGFPFDKPSINPDCLLEANEVAIHPAEYHKLTVKALVKAGAISSEPHRYVIAGCYTVAVHKVLRTG
jgi:hypothetical protein